jgi:hypothetical protein
VWWLLLACAGGPAPEDSDDQAAVDLDGDGVVASADRDDADRSVGASFLAWRDTDRDGWGDSEGQLEVCGLRPSLASERGDCDDSDPTVHPGATETCDDRDEDCNGLGDEGQPWYADADADGWGDEATRVDRCTAPDAAVATAGDCDDADPATYPGAWDHCFDGTDQDCDGGDSVCRYPAEIAMEDVAVAIYAAEKGGQLGYSVAGVGDQNGDALPDVGFGAPTLDTEHGQGVIYIAAAAAPGAHDADDLAMTTIAGGAPSTYYSHAGWALAGGGDVTGDGVADLIDRAWLVPGPVVGQLQLQEAVVARYDYNSSYEYAMPGDLDGDGRPDVLVGNAAHEDGGVAPPSGAVWLYDDIPANLVTGDSDAVGGLIGRTGDLAGYQVAGPGDVDGDGRPDILVSAPSNDARAWSAGRVFLVTDVPEGQSYLDDAAEAILRAPNPYERLGQYGLSGAGDVDGDGYADLLLGSSSAPPDHHGEGSPEQWVCASLVLGPVSGDLHLEAVAHARYEAVVSRDCLHTRVSGPGDMDGDGFDDVAIGADSAQNLDGDIAGAVYLFYTNPSGVVSLADADSRLYSREFAADLGWSMDAAGDVNGDGFADLVVGAPQAGVGGAAFIVLGGL